MKKPLKHKSSLASPQVESDMAEPNIAVLINQMQQQLGFLEKKIDTLISQSSERPFKHELIPNHPIGLGVKGEHYPKSPRSFDRPYRHNRTQQGNSFRERSFTQAICADCNKECEVPFKPSGDRPVYCKECFSKRKDVDSPKGRYDNRPREAGFVQGRHFDKQQGGENRRSGERKKPVFRKRSR